MRISLKPCRAAGCCILAVFISLPFKTAAFTQAPQPEQRVATQDNPRIIVINAPSTSILPWEKNEVSISAQVSGVSILSDEVKVKAEKNKLEINCVPLKPDRIIYLTLRVPRKSVLAMRNAGNNVEVKEPSTQTNVNMTANFVELNVPETSSLDMRAARNAFELRTIGQGGSLRAGIGNRRIDGPGPTDVKVTAEMAMVIVSRGTTAAPNPPSLPSTRNATIAATTIARRGGSMSKSLRRSNPQLMRPQRDQPSAAASSEREEDAVKLEAHLVNLNVSATDKDGKAVAGLKQEDFSIYEDGVLQRISFFTPERSPFNLVLLIDLSGSMKDEIDLIKQTALHFLDVISAQDSVAVITFTTDVTVVSHLTKDRDDLRDSISWMLAPAGGTSFYDALGFALVEAFRKVKGQRNAVIVLSDGEDNAIPTKLLQQQQSVRFRGAVPGSFLTFEELLDGATESDALIYPIHLNPTAPQIFIQSNLNSPPRVQSPPPQHQSEVSQVAIRQLRSLADASGGRFYHADRIADLKGVFEQVAAELRTVYSMAYTPTNQNYDGSFRKIRVQVNSADVAVRTRPGYYGR